MQLKIDSHTFVPLYHKQFDCGHDKVYRIILTETLSVPTGHTKKHPCPHSQLETTPNTNCALLEPRDKFESSKKASAPNVFSDFTEEVFSIAVDNKTEEEITIYRNNTPRSSEFLPEAVINNISKLPKSQPVPTKNNKYNSNIIKKSVDRGIPTRFYDQFESLVKEFSDIFFQTWMEFR